MSSAIDSLAGSIQRLVSALQSVFDAVVEWIKSAWQWLCDHWPHAIQVLENIAEEAPLTADTVSTAKERSMRLLMRHLDKKQREMFMESRTVVVKAYDSNTLYAIEPTRSYGMNAVVKHATMNKYWSIARLCVFPEGYNVPIYDGMLQIMLMLKAPGGEKKILKEANIAFSDVGNMNNPRPPDSVRSASAAYRDFANKVAQQAV